jgi:DNA-binding MarR family transcriptional regulator
MADLSHPLNCLTFNLQRAARRLARGFEATAKESGLTAPQFATLSLIGGMGEVTVTKLAEQMDTDRTTMTRNLDVLLHKGWIAEAESADARLRILRLTEPGQKKLADALPAWTAFQRRLVGSIGEAASQDLLRTLKEL